MEFRRMRVLAVSLLVLAAPGCATPPRGADPLYGREPVALTQAERDFVLAEMRRYLQALRGIVEGVAEGDRKAVAAAARGAGMQTHRAQLAGPHAAAASVESKLPAGYLSLAAATHSAFDEIALHAERSGERDYLLASLADNMRRCVACHNAYRLPQ